LGRHGIEMIPNKHRSTRDSGATMTV
jgi:hypothetical protein